MMISCKRALFQCRRQDEKHRYDHPTRTKPDHPQRRYARTHHTGSRRLGKTSIAFTPYCLPALYTKGKISSKDILIISPNKVFADYISNVLPELGETTVPETSMEQILSTVLDNKYKFQNFFGQVSELLEKPTPDFIERIQYKASFEFVSRLDKFILHMENHYFRATDVKLTKYITIPAEFVGEQFKRFHRYPIRQRFETMTDYILEMMKIQYNLTVTTAEKTC